MSLPAGLTVVVLILVLFPLAAVWLAGRWRDPPPEKWGIPPERLAASRNSPELVAYRRRIELGLTQGPRATAVEKAIRTGTAAPPELRAAAHELARVRLEELDHRRPRARARFALWLVVALLVLGGGLYGALVHGGWFLVIYSAVWFFRAWVNSPWMERRQRRRVEAAVAVNAAR